MKLKFSFKKKAKTDFKASKNFPTFSVILSKYTLKRKITNNFFIHKHTLFLETFFFQRVKNIESPRDFQGTYNSSSVYRF